MVIDQGSIVDIGPHDALLVRCDKYQDLVRRQLRGNSVEPVGNADNTGTSNRAVPNHGLRMDHAAASCGNLTSDSLKEPLVQ